LIFASPDLLNMPEEIVSDLRSHGANVIETEDLYGSMADADVVYMTRIQKERFADEDEYARCAGAYKLHARHLSEVKQDMIIMHPLPRVDEIDPSVDTTRHARYFEQAFNGVVARMALLCRLLGVTVPAKIEGVAL
jgi:aspartate carbamoyltransferase catalytic subunit